MTGPTDFGRCPGCGSAEWTMLPDPGPRSVASDLRIVEEPLARRACRACGLAMRTASASTGSTMYTEGYGLYAHAPGGRFEASRQNAYASWIASLVPPPPRRILDVGCGNGSLLLALRDRWPQATLLGCDPSGESVARGDGAGVRLWQGASSALEAHGADLVVSVNVIEHTADPGVFLRDLNRACEPGGRVVVICPDGGRPGVELLFADHLFSLDAGTLRELASRAGLETLAWEAAPPSLGSFQAMVWRPSVGIATTPPVAVRGAAPGGAYALNAGRAAYLAQWRALDAALAARLPDGAVCFGVGEAAGLLRAYAPLAWAKVRACTADVVTASRFGVVPVVPLDTLPGDTEMLVAVRPADQARVAERLAARFASAVTWYDLVPL